MTTEAVKTETVFTSAEAATPAEAKSPSTVDELVGQGKKFKDLDALAKSKLEADKFIERLLQEKEEIKRELDSRIKAAEALEAARNQSRQSEPERTAPEFDPASISEIVRQELSEAERAKTFKENVLSAQDALIKFTGSREAATKYVEDKAQELGVQKEWLLDMAGRSPKALLNTLGVQSETKPGVPSPVVPKSSINTEADKSITKQPTTKAHFDEIRRTNPSMYWSPKVQQEIFKLQKEGRYT